MAEQIGWFGWWGFLNFALSYSPMWYRTCLIYAKKKVISISHSWKLYSPACGGGGYLDPANLSILELAQCPELHFTELP